MDHPFAPVLDQEDFAAPPSRTQAFPIVVPLSNQKHGPQDTRPPMEVWSKLNQDELADDEWTCRRDREQAALVRAAAATTLERHRLKQAERNTQHVEILTQQRAFELERAGIERQKRGNLAVQAKALQLENARQLLEDARQDCAQRLAEEKVLLETELAHTRQVEQLLELERERVAAAHRKSDESQAISRARLLSREADVERVRLECERRVADAKKAAEGRIKAVKQRLQPDMLETQQRLDTYIAQCNERVDFEQTRNNATASRAKEMEVTAIQRESVDENRRRLHENSVIETWDGVVETKAQREADTSAWVDSWRPADDLAKESKAKSAASHRKEHLSNQSLGQAAHVLGHYYACQRQYTPTVDNKLSALLGGALHPSAPTGHEPSARALSPPPGVMALHAPPNSLGSER